MRIDFLHDHPGLEHAPAEVQKSVIAAVPIVEDIMVAQHMTFAIEKDEDIAMFRMPLDPTPVVKYDEEKG